MAEHHLIPHFHNASGVAAIEVGVREFMCVGAPPPFDHPHIFIDMGDGDEVVCSYCATLYRHNPALSGLETVPPGHLYETVAAWSAVRPTRTIAIAGAGIGGLTAALALAQCGFRVSILERAAELSEIGAGLQLSPNAGRVLAALGLDEAVASAAVEPAAIEVQSGRSGRRIVTMPLGAYMQKRWRGAHRVVHRGDLQRILLDAVRSHPDIELTLGAELVGFGAHENGVTGMAARDGGHIEVRAGALIAADGVRSRVRAAMPGGMPLRHAGRTAWRAIMRAADAPAGIPSDRIGLWLGKDAHFVHYPIRGGREINLVAIVKDDWDGEGWAEPGDLLWLRRRFAGWEPPVQRSLPIPYRWTKWPLLTVDPAGPWVAGPVALLGDAAHAMAPFLAQGAAMAIEDAAVLAAELAAAPNDVPAALKRYEARRKPRVRRVWRAARGNGELYHMSGVTGAIRDLGMMAVGGRGLIGNYAWLWKWKPPALAPAAPPAPAAETGPVPMADREDDAAEAV